MVLIFGVFGLLFLSLVCILCLSGCNYTNIFEFKQTELKQNSNIFERILQLADLKGIKNIPDLAIFLGYSSAEKLYRLRRSPDAKPSYEIVEDFTNKFEDLNVRWFVSGEGRPLLGYSFVDTPVAEMSLNEELVEYVTLARQDKRGKSAKSASPAAGASLAKQIYLTPQFITVDNNGDENIVHVSAKAAAGYLRGYADPVYLERLPSFKLPGLTEATYRSFEVDGDSMNPTLKSGQMVIGRWVEKLDYIRDDRVHILVTKSDGIVIKRLLNRIDQYNKIIAKSDATNDRGLYKNIEVDPDDILEIWYAVFHGGFDFQSPADMWKRVNNHEADITVLQNTVNELMSVIKSAGLLKK
jgi:hypothetical protein